MIEIHPVRSDDLETFFTAMSGPFGFDLPDGDDRAAMLERSAKLFEPDRARCAFDDGRIVGTLGVFSFEMTVPGGSMPVAGTTMVTVQVTHRRSGVLSDMMRAHLDEATDRGDAAAALWASDSAIYGRFGYGMAAWSTEIEIDRRHIDFHRLAPNPAAVEIVDAESVRAPAIAVYDDVRAETPGMVGHSEGWWDRIFGDLAWTRHGATKARYGLVREDGQPTGWVKFRLKDTEGHGHPAQDVLVSQLYATTPAAWAGLWKHALSHDFGQTIKADLRPIDDPIHSLLRGMRRVKTLRSDGLWIRVLDVARLFEARRYGTAGVVTFTVSDPADRVPGSYRLETSPDTAEITRVSDGEIELDVEDLGALSLGGRSAVELARAGRIRGDQAAIGRFDRMLRSERAPWSPVIF